MENVRHKLTIGAFAALALSTPAPSIADVVITETGTVTGYTNGNYPNAPNLLGDAFTASIDFPQGLPQITGGICQTEQCYFSNGDDVGSTTISAAGQTLVEPNVFINRAYFSSATGSGTYNVLQLGSGAIDSVRSTINATSSAIPDPFTNNISYSSPVNGTLYSEGFGSPSGGLSLAYGLITVNVTNLTINSQLPPSPYQLSQLSADTYNKQPTGISGFSVLTRLSYGNGLVAVLYGSPDKSQIVLAFQGTDPSNNKNLLTDAAIGLGNTNATLSEYVGDAEQALHALSIGNPNANITLTGYSLGGGIAQLLGTASGLNTVAFDAPGMAAQYNNYSSELSSLANLGSGSENVNYRLYGDQVSLSGTQLGNVLTVGNSGGPTSIIDSVGTLAAHSISALSQDLAPNSGVTPTSGVSGPDFSPYYNNIIFPILNGSVLDIAIQSVTAYNHYFIDPASFNDFVLTGLPSSPDFNSLALPTLNGIDGYLVRWKTGNTWSAFSTVAPGYDLQFGTGVDGIEFRPLDNTGNFADVPNAFLFDTTFSSDGSFNGVLSQNQIGSSVPEPLTWMLLVFGFGLIGGNLRRERFMVIIA